MPAGSFVRIPLSERSDENCDTPSYQTRRYTKSKLDTVDRQRVHYQLERDVYNALLVSLAHDTSIAGVKSCWFRCNLILSSLLLSILSSSMQFVLSRTLVVHVETNMLQSMNGQVNLAWSHKVYAGASLTGPLSEEICGKFDYSNLKEGPEAKLAFPDGSVQVGLQTYNKVPLRRWDARWMGQDRCVLDRVRFILSEGYTLMHQGYAYLFIMVNVLWLSSIGVEIRSVVRLALMLCAMPSNGSDQGCVLQYLANQNAFKLNQLPLHVKVVGFVIVAMRLFLGLWVGYAGVYFLRFSDSMVDLILNAVALGFILELDNILFKTLLSNEQQDWVDTLKPIEYVSVLSRIWRECCLSHVFPFLGCLSVLLGAAYVRWAQLHVYHGFYENAAGACLFLGPAPEGEFRPVPGFCESLLKMTCVRQGTGKAAHNPCVVTDYNTPWSKDLTQESVKSAYIEDVFTAADPNEDNIFHFELNQHSEAAGKFRLVDGQDGTFFDSGVLSPYMPGVHQMQRACRAMYQLGKPMRDVDGTPAAPFSCKADTGLGEYFKNFTYVYETSTLTGQSVDSTPSRLPLLSQDPELGKRLHRCGR